MQHLTTLSKQTSAKGAASFHVKAQKDKANTRVVIFLNHDKQPIYGTSFASKTPPNQLIEWAQAKVKEYPKHTIK